MPLPVNIGLQQAHVAALYTFINILPITCKTTTGGEIGAVTCGVYLSAVFILAKKSLPVQQSWFSQSKTPKDQSAFKAIVRRVLKVTEQSTQATSKHLYH